MLPRPSAAAHDPSGPGPILGDAAPAGGLRRRTLLAAAMAAAGVRTLTRDPAPVAVAARGPGVLAAADVPVPAPPPAALDFGPLAAPGAVTGTRVWSGTIAGTPAWVTVVARGHALGPGSSWTDWGNATSDVYAFAFGSADAVRLLVQFDRQQGGEVVATLWDGLFTQGAPLAYAVAADGTMALPQPPTLRLTAAAPAWVDPEGRAVYDLLLRSETSPVEMEQLRNMPTRIRVGGVAGVPLWQTDALDPMPGGIDGFMRWFSAQRLRSAPAYSPGPPLHPAFPYLGVTPPSGFMGAEGRLPLFFDVQSGLLVVSAFVGWKYGGLYQTHSVSAPPHLDFDSPWIFERFLPHTAHAQLTVQLHNFPPGDVFNAQPPAGGGGCMAVRYTWAGESGRHWAYSLGLGGQPAFPLGHSRVGGVALDVPGPEGIACFALRLPAQGRSFVQAMQPYTSSEGIYEYGMGWTPEAAAYVHPTLGQAQDSAMLIAGERGEYQIPAVGPEPLLYTCPLDGLVHLWQADGGVWYPGGSDLVRLLAAGGPCLDTWVREVLPDPTQAIHGVPQELLSQLGDEVLWWGPARGQGAGMAAASGSAAAPGLLRLHRGGQALAAATYAPPSDGVSWWRFLQATRGYRRGKDPLDLGSWLPPRAPLLAAYRGDLEVPPPRPGVWSAVLHVVAVLYLAPALALRWPDRPGRYILSRTRSGWQVG
jgi:hypothetical protein